MYDKISHRCLFLVSYNYYYMQKADGITLKITQKNDFTYLSIKFVEFLKIYFYITATEQGEQLHQIQTQQHYQAKQHASQ